MFVIFWFTMSINIYFPFDFYRKKVLKKVFDNFSWWYLRNIGKEMFEKKRKRKKQTEKMKYKIIMCCFAVKFFFKEPINSHFDNISLY